MTSHNALYKAFSLTLLLQQPVTSDQSVWALRIRFKKESDSNHIWLQSGWSLWPSLLGTHLCVFFFVYLSFLFILQGPPGGGGPPGTPIMPSPGGELIPAFYQLFTEQEFCLSGSYFLILIFHWRLRSSRFTRSLVHKVTVCEKEVFKVSVPLVTSPTNLQNLGFLQISCFIKK